MCVKDIWREIDNIINLISGRNVIVVGDSQAVYNIILHLNKSGIKVDSIVDKLPEVTMPGKVYLIHNEEEDCCEINNIICFNFHKLQDGIMKSDNIYIYGSGSSGIRTLEIFRENGIKVKGFIDSDIKKRGKMVQGLEISHIKDVEAGMTIVISTQYYEEIYCNLKKCNVGVDSIYVDYANSLCWSDQPLYYKCII